MKANYNITIQFQVEKHIEQNNMKELQSNTELAIIIGQLVCDELVSSDTIALYNIINSSVKVS